MLAVTATAIGFAYDAGTGDKELSAFFTFCYVAGCVLAVLAVRRSGIFTAVIQPPLILFVAVPSAYLVFHSDKIAGIKDLLINCGYPLIERFPTMFFTAAAILILGLIRWFVLPQFLTYADDDEAEAEADAESTPRRTRRQADDEDAAPAGLAATLSAKLTKLTTGQTPRSTRTRATPSRRSSPDSPRRGTADPQRAPRPTRARAHADDTELIEPVPGQMRRPRPARPRPAATDPYAVPDEPRRRPRPASDSREPRRTPPQERYDYREPRERDRYERPAQRPSASEPRRRRYADDPYEPGDRYQSPARPSRNAPPSGAHHPVSRVRYRGSDDDAAAPEPHERRPRQPQNWD